MSVFKCAGSKMFDLEGKPYCTYEAPRSWHGKRCPGCRRFYDVHKVGSDVRNDKPRITAANSTEIVIEYIPTGVHNFDRVIGGGLVKKSAILFGGPRGSGKSTLSMMVCDSVSKATGKKVMYASAEEGVEGVLKICKRTGILNEDIVIFGRPEASDVHDVIEHCKKERPLLTVFDSLQALCFGDMPPSSQRDAEVAEVINDHCKKSGMCAILMNHMNRKEEMVGSTKVGHYIDTELRIHAYNATDDGRARDVFTRELLDTINLDDVRVLIVDKNREGASNVKEFFLMTSEGLRGLSKKPKIELVT